MLRGKINAAERVVTKLRRQSEFIEAYNTLEAMRRALATMEK